MDKYSLITFSVSLWTDRLSNDYVHNSLLSFLICNKFCAWLRNVVGYASVVFRQTESRFLILMVCEFQF